jgi:hypothetical protein
MTNDLELLCVNTIRTLSIDAVQRANSRHPGLPLGAAAMAFVLWTRFLKHNPQGPCGPIVTDLYSLRVMAPCCCTAYFTSPATICLWMN